MTLFRVMLVACLALVAATPADACGPLARLRARVQARAGGGCSGGGFQQQQQQQDQQFGQGDNTSPNNDTVSFAYVQYAPQPAVAAAPAVTCPCVQQQASPAADTVSAKPVKAEAPDDSRPGVGIAAVEKRTTALEAEVAALKAQVAALTAGTSSRSTVYLSGSAPVPQYPVVQYRTVNAPAYFPSAAPPPQTVCSGGVCRVIR